ncbi:hypothetical protein BOX15_Mlig002974g2, partial [Macrostomum lignano]
LVQSKGGKISLSQGPDKEFKLMAASQSSTSEFSSLGLKPWLLSQLSALSITKPTPVQRACIPAVLAGRDVIGCAETGSGKTLAFALPIMHQLLDDPVGPYALVVTPTRELAFQITDQLRVLCQALNFRLLTVTGGRDVVEQGRMLAARPHFIVGTPGRLADHVRSNSSDLHFSSLRYLILDEADRLLEDNFGRDLAAIVEAVPADRQTLLFSATYTEAVSAALATAAAGEDGETTDEGEAKSKRRQPPFVFNSSAAEVDDISAASASGSGSSGARLPESLNQYYCLMPAQVKDAFLIHIVSDFLAKNPTSLIVVFTNKCKWCHLLGLMFKALGLDSALLHSALTQRQRLDSLARFKSNQVRVLISTDVGSRGLDIPLVDLVISHNVPTRPKDYVHRCGRTARAGRPGTAILLANQFELALLKDVERLIDRRLEEMKVDEAQVAKIVTDVVVARREAEIRLDELRFDEKREERREKQQFVECQRQLMMQEDGASAAGPSRPSSKHQKPKKRPKGVSKALAKKKSLKVANVRQKGNSN